nr:transmembrane protein LIL5 [Polypedilum vanderplanki]
MELKSILKFDAFLCLFDLESCGIIIGALGLLFAFFQINANIILLLFLFFAGNSCLQQYFTDGSFIRNIFAKGAQNGFENFTGIAEEEIKNIVNSENSCSNFSKFVFALILIGGIFLNVISIIAHYRIIKGVEEYNTSRFHLPSMYYKFFIIIEGISLFLLAICSFFSFAMFVATILTLIFFVTDIYNYIIIEKLRIKYLSQPHISLIFIPQNLKKPKNQKQKEKKNKRVEELKKDEKNENFCCLFEHKPPTNNYYKPPTDDHYKPSNKKEDKNNDNIDEVVCVN